MDAGSGDRVGWLGASLDRRLVRPTSSEAREDAFLVDTARAGDRDAFGLLYERYGRMVHGILVARVPLGDVDDLLQDVFLTALRKLHALRDAGSFGGWLAAIARNRAHDHHRHSVSAVEWNEDLSPNPLESSPIVNAHDDVTTAGEAAVVLAAICSLPDAYKETLVLRLVEGMTGPEIAARTGLTPGSVRVNLHRGMQLLREKLDRATGKKGQQETSSP